MPYVFAEEWHRERERLAGVEAAMDPNTIDVLSRLKIDAGWRCAEVGAGAGSIAELLAEWVGPAGQVVATDLDTRYLDALTAPNIEVRKHDLTRDPPPGEPFDLVHTRAVIEHVDDPADAIRRLAGWLRPGGILVVEDLDWTGLSPLTPADAFHEVMATGLRVAGAAAGYDSGFGRRLPALVHESGLTAVDAHTHGFVVRGATPQMEALKLIIERLAPAMTASGLSPDLLAEAMGLCDDPTFAALSPNIVSVWGRAA